MIDWRRILSKHTPHYKWPSLIAAGALLLGLFLAISGARAASPNRFPAASAASFPDVAQESSSRVLTATVPAQFFLPYLLNQQLTQAQLFLPYLFNQQLTQARLHPSPVLSDHNLAAGDFGLDITAQDVLELSQFAFTLHYDPNIVQAVDAHIGPLLLDTGRNVTPRGPFIDNNAGVIRFDAASSGAASGASGTGIIATIVFRPQHVGRSGLSWTYASMTNTAAQPIPALTQDGSIVISFSPVTSTPTPSPSPMPSATPTATPTATPLPGVGLSPSSLTSTHSLGAGAFTLDIDIQNVLNLGAFQFMLHFDPAILQAQTANLAPFLASSGRTVLPLAPVIDNTAGTITFGGFSFGSQSGASGSGIIARLEFLPLRTGTTTLTWSDDILADTQANSVDHTSFKGKIIIGDK